MLPYVQNIRLVKLPVEQELQMHLSFAIFPFQLLKNFKD